MSNVTISATTLEGFTPPLGLTTVEMRVYCDIPFVPNGEPDPVQSGTVGSSTWFRKFTCTVVGENLSVPEVVLPATLDGSPGTAKYSISFYKPGVENFFIAQFSGLQSFSLPVTTPTTWAAIFAANNPAPSLSLAGTGIFAQTAPLTFALRTITGTSNQVTVTNGDGVSGNPTISLPTTVFLGTAGGSPTAGTLKGPDASGTNTTGANLELAAGPGTGNAVQGLAGFRYPLSTSSGASVQSLSTDLFPPWVNMHIRNDGDITVVNTTTETSILGASQAGSTKTLEAGIARAGRFFFIRVFGQIGTTGTPTLRARLKLGAVTLADTTAIAMFNNTASPFGGLTIEAVAEIVSVGVAGNVRTPMLKVSYITANGGAVNAFANAGGLTAVNLTGNPTFDLTVEWGTANASNTATFQSSVISMSR